MMVAGSGLLALSVAALVVSLRPGSAVRRRLDLIAPRDRPHASWRPVREIDLRHAGVGIDADRFLALRAGTALAGGLLAATISLVVPIGVVPIALAAYGGAVAPALLVDARARARRAGAEAAAALLVERLEALVSSGRPPETALSLLMRRSTGSPLLDATLTRAAEAHVLGAPIFRTLAAHAREEGLATCAALAEELERARDLGTGSLAAIRERRRSLRASERARCLEAASQVEGKLMLVLVLCYLPALVLLVVVPLFIGLLEGLFA
jgi:tight adherence protein C